MNRDIVELIMQEVLAEIEKRGGIGTTDRSAEHEQSVGIGMQKVSERCKTMLVIGCEQDVPTHCSQGYIIKDIEDYKQQPDITRYDAVFITALTLTELSDIAQGRDASANACAVVHALLQGMEVAMIPSALPHRQFVGKANGKLYSLIERNVNMLEIYGVKIVEELQSTPVECYNCLITEGAALEMVKRGEKEIVLPKKTIITPSAWDVFHANGVVVVCR